jgi:hypothetical protein
MRGGRIWPPDYRAGKAIGDDGVLRGEGFARLPGPYQVLGVKNGRFILHSS